MPLYWDSLILDRTEKKTTTYYEGSFHKLYKLSCLYQEMMHSFSNVKQLKGLYALKLIYEKQKITQEAVSLVNVIMVFNDVHQTKYFLKNHQDRQYHTFKGYYILDLKRSYLH